MSKLNNSSAAKAGAHGLCQRTGAFHLRSVLRTGDTFSRGHDFVKFSGRDTASKRRPG